MMKYLQKIGKSLMLPVAVMPAAALLLGIGYRLDPVGWGANSPAAAFLIKSGASILDNIPILFAVGIAVGTSKEKDGSAALAGLVGFFSNNYVIIKRFSCNVDKSGCRKSSFSFWKNK